MSELKDKIKNIIDKLQGRHIFLYLIFVVISTIFWFLLTLNNEVQQEYKLSLSINSIPENTTFISETPQNIKVIVREKGTSSLKYILTSLPVISVNFNDFSDNKNIFRINNTDLKNLISKAIGSNPVILSTYPDSVKAVFTNHTPKKVPIKFNINVTPNFKYTLSGKIKCSKDSAIVYSDIQTLNKIQYVESAELIMKDLTDTLNEEIPIIPIKGTKIVPNSINVSIPVEPLIIKKSMVKVRTNGVPEGYNIITFPSKVQASYLIPLSKYKSEQNIFAEIYFNEINKNNKKIKLHSYPETWDYGSINFESDSIDYIIEEFN